jgi:hypothetical protein
VGFEEAVDAAAEKRIAEGGGVEFAEESLVLGFDFEAGVEEGDDEGWRIGSDIFKDEGGADGGGEEQVEAGEECEAPTAGVIAEAGDFAGEAQELGDITKIETIEVIGGGESGDTRELVHSTSLMIFPTDQNLSGFARQSLKRCTSVEKAKNCRKCLQAKNKKAATDRLYTDTG